MTGWAGAVAVGSVVAVETAVSATAAVAEAVAAGWVGAIVAGGSVDWETAVAAVGGVGGVVGVGETTVGSGVEQATNKKMKRKVYLFIVAALYPPPMFHRHPENCPPLNRQRGKRIGNKLCSATQVMKNTVL